MPEIGNEPKIGDVVEFKGIRGKIIDKMGPLIRVKSGDQVYTFNISEVRIIHKMAH